MGSLSSKPKPGPKQGVHTSKQAQQWVTDKVRKDDFRKAKAAVRRQAKRK